LTPSVADRDWCVALPSRAAAQRRVGQQIERMADRCGVKSSRLSTRDRSEPRHGHMVLAMRHGRRKARRPVKGAVTAVLLTLLLMAGAVAPAGSVSAADTVTFSATQTIPVPPASTFAGSGGDDGWALAFRGRLVL
jgi:hypothetical protein